MLALRLALVLQKTRNNDSQHRGILALMLFMNIYIQNEIFLPDETIVGLVIGLQVTLMNISIVVFFYCNGI